VSREIKARKQVGCGSTRGGGRTVPIEKDKASVSLRWGKKESEIKSPCVHCRARNQGYANLFEGE
jgi:hypothetical protein